MIDLLALTTLIQKPMITPRKENFVIIGKQVPASTFKGFNDFHAQMQAKDSLATYQSTPITKPDDEEDRFVSPIMRSVTVSARFVVGGLISRPLIDDDDIVDFDE